MALLRAEGFRRSGGFDESLRLSQDWEFLCRVAAREEILYLPGPPVLEYRLRQDSATQSLGCGDAGFAERLRAIDRAFGNPAVTADFPPAYWRGCAGAAWPTSPPGWARWRCGTGIGPRPAASSGRCLQTDPARPREAILLVFSLLRWLPPAVDRRLK